MRKLYSRATRKKNLPPLLQKTNNDNLGQLFPTSFNLSFLKYKGALSTSKNIQMKSHYIILPTAD